MNRYGLKRDIPEVIKREVRQRCGFGCIICGTAVIQYHHFDPPFVNSEKHDPWGITLLCPTCHEKVSKKIFDEDFIRYSISNPFCKRTEFVKDVFHVGNEPITFQLGNVKFKNLDIIQVDNLPLISFSPPEQKGAPFRLNANFYDKYGHDMLQVLDNEWRAGTENFDIETKANELIIREKKGILNFNYYMWQTKKL